MCDQNWKQFLCSRLDKLIYERRKRRIGLVMVQTQLWSQIDLILNTCSIITEMYYMDFFLIHNFCFTREEKGMFKVCFSFIRILYYKNLNNNDLNSSHKTCMN